MECYVLKMNIFENELGGSNDDFDWMLLQFQAIKYTSVDLTTNKMLQGCVGKVNRFKSIDEVGTPICSGSADNISLNPTLNVLSAINCGGWNL